MTRQVCSKRFLDILRAVCFSTKLRGCMTMYGVSLFLYFIDRWARRMCETRVASVFLCASTRMSTVIMLSLPGYVLVDFVQICWEVAALVHFLWNMNVLKLLGLPCWAENRKEVSQCLILGKKFIYAHFPEKSHSWHHSISGDCCHYDVAAYMCPTESFRLHCAQLWQLFSLLFSVWKCGMPP